MALIEVDTNVYFDTTLQWYQQSDECVAMGESLMLETPQSINMESCIDDKERMLIGTWITTTATGTFDMTVDRTNAYEYPSTSKAFLSKEHHDIVTVTEI